jgi:hypothetical protein
MLTVQRLCYPYNDARREYSCKTANATHGGSAYSDYSKHASSGVPAGYFAIVALVYFNCMGAELGTGVPRIRDRSPRVLYIIMIK